MDDKDLAISLKLYKQSLGKQRLTVKDSKRVPVEKGQFRVLLWEPWEYIMVVDVEEEGLVHAVPFTIWTALTTSGLRLKLHWLKRDRLFAPLPFMVYLRKEIVERESLLVAKLKEETISTVLKNVRRTPNYSVNKYQRSFLKLVWKRFEDLSLSSVIYTHMLRERKESEQRGLIIQYPSHIIQKYQTQLQAYQLAAMESVALRGKNWLGVVEEGQIVIYLPKELEGKRIRIKLFDEVLYEGIGEEKVVLEGVPKEYSHEYMEEKLHVELLED